MPENGMPGPVCDLSSVRESVCIHTRKIFGKWEGAERFLKEYGVSLQGFGYYSLTQPETNVYQFTVYRDS